MTTHPLLLAPFERADIVDDFSEHAGETFTVTTDAEFPFEGETEGNNLDELYTDDVDLNEQQGVMRRYANK